MFSFSRERHTEVRQHGLLLTQEDEDDLKAMELEEERISDNEEEGGGEQEQPDTSTVFNIVITEPFQFPEPRPPFEVNQTTRCVRFIPTVIPNTLPNIQPGIMKGLASIKELTIGQKRTICGHMCMPMPVESSPIVSLFMTKVTGGASIPWKPQYINYMLSVFQLREFMLAIVNGLIPFHQTMTQEKIQYAFDEFKAHIAFYEHLQERRARELLCTAKANPAMTPDVLKQFISYLEEYSFYYIHSIERFIYITIIEPHLTPEHNLTLANFLTSNAQPTLSACLDPISTRKYVSDFFAIKVAVFKKHDDEVCDVDYVKKDTLNVQQLPHRIAVHPQTKELIYNCPRNMIWREFIDLQTIYEYFCFCDSENILGNDFYWDPRSWYV